MATDFKNKVVKEIGVLPVLALGTDSATRSTIVGLSLSNLKEVAVYATVLIGDDTSVSGFYLKDVMIPPNTSLRALSAGEKLILAPNNTLYLQADEDAALDAVISYVDIV
jgi:hypothetical protein